MLIWPDLLGGTEKIQYFDRMGNLLQEVEKNGLITGSKDKRLRF